MTESLKTQVLDVVCLVSLMQMVGADGGQGIERLAT